MNEKETLKFVPFKSCVDPSFWHRLAEIKLNIDKLNGEPREIWGYCDLVAPRGLNSVIFLNSSSFNEIPEKGYQVIKGILLNTNTIEEFFNIDKRKYLSGKSDKILQNINSTTADYSELIKFELLCFADLKNFKFNYWFGFPAFNIFTGYFKKSPTSATQVFSENILVEISRNANENFFMFNIQKDDNVQFLNSISQANAGTYFGFLDSSDDPKYPGWGLRNFILFLQFHRPDLLSDLNIFCLRTVIENGKKSIRNSLLLNIEVKSKDLLENALKYSVGWERNNQGHYSPKIADLHNSMDPLTLSENAVNLNLKLMKWQLAPDLNLEKIAATKCLLLGAGTLGCVVARSLLAWGVQHITFIDKGKISYSNPVRQNLYTFKDIGGTKAEVAARVLQEIHPAVTSKGWEMTIPMPGHPVGQSLLEETKNSVELLENLIKTHDAIFLLMDSRESRWLPTMLAAVHSKIVINAALGFESYLVMRHGVKVHTDTVATGKKIPGNLLGCYFCNDVTAPGNSAQGRTLDQQCTVTRPGVSCIAGALAVELLVSILQHPDEGLCTAYLDDAVEESLLGLVPHSVRGYLSRYQVILPATEAFKSCVACSEKVSEEYKKEGFVFVLKVLNSSVYLEEVTGLSKLQNFDSGWLDSEDIEFND